MGRGSIAYNLLKIIYFQSVHYVTVQVTDRVRNSFIHSSLLYAQGRLKNNKLRHTQVKKQT